MQMSDNYLNKVLTEAQQLLWGGSETENIEAHNLIAKLIKDRNEQNQISQGPNRSLTNTNKYRRKGIYNFVNILYNIHNNYIS